MGFWYWGDLAGVPEVVASDEGLEAGSNTRAAVVLADFELEEIELYLSKKSLRSWDVRFGLPNRSSRGPRLALQLLPERNSYSVTKVGALRPSTVKTEAFRGARGLLG